jgi:hypothetical protein
MSDNVTRVRPAPPFEAYRATISDHAVDRHKTGVVTHEFRNLGMFIFLEDGKTEKRTFDTQWWTIHREPAESSEWVTAPDGEEFRVGQCQGHAACPVERHEHGCYADDGTNCDHPDEHPQPDDPLLDERRDTAHALRDLGCEIEDKRPGDPS